jgi:hypothetical protein
MVLYGCCYPLLGESLNPTPSPLLYPATLPQLKIDGIKAYG